MARIFLSYASPDRELTARIAEDLESDGHDVWWDTDLVGGDSFRSVIDAELEAAEVAIVVWTPTSVRSSWVIAEADHAMRLSKLLPVRSESVKDWQIPKPFGTLHTQSVADRAALRRAVARIVSGGVPSEAPRPDDPPTRRAEASAEVQIKTYLLFMGLLLLIGTGLAVVWRNDNRPDKTMLMLAGTALATVVIVVICLRLCRSTRNPAYYTILTAATSNLGVYSWMVGGAAAAYWGRWLNFQWTFTAGAAALSTWAVVLAFQIRGASWVLPAARFLSIVQLGWLAVHVYIQLGRSNYETWFQTSDYALLHLLYVATGVSGLLIAASFLVASYGYSRTSY
jgi:hypothetical protein